MKFNIYHVITLSFAALVVVHNISSKCKPTQAKRVSIAPFYNEQYPFSLPNLPYNYNALEPYIDATTMEIHHTKHHKAYVDNLNSTLKNHPELQQKTLSDLLTQIDSYPTDIKTALRNHAGGHFNHSLFWTIMNQSGTPISKKLESHIIKAFGSFELFQEKFNNCAKSIFGSGWAWLVTNKKGNLSIIATHNQDTPLSDIYTPILCLDVWEHAYYLKYQNQRVNYITAFWHVINWKQVEEYYNRTLES